MTTIDALILGIVQGITEFLPISSSGHLILMRQWLAIPEQAEFLIFDAVMHLATAIAIVIYFRKDLLGRVKNVFHPEERKKSFWLYIVVVATIPAAVIGFLFEDTFTNTFRSTETVIVMLLLGSVLLAFAETIGRKREKEENHVEMTFLSLPKAFCIGIFQALALLPGTSRSGSTLSGGVFLGLSRLEATRFAFLMGLPVLFGVGVLKLYDALGTSSFDLALIATGSISAFIVGMASIWLLMKIVTHNSLWWFVGYRILLAFILLVIII